MSAFEHPRGEDGERFVAPLWARGPHAQTLAARVLRSGVGPSMSRERLHTPDDDFIDVDWGPDPGADAPIVLVLHGLEGSSRRRYVKSVARELLARRIRPVALNLRGCSGEPNRALRFYHSGETTDPAWLLDLIRARFPERRVGAMGFSLGGNMLLKLMGERADGGSGLVDAAVAMSVPYDLAAGCALLERSPMGRVYSGYFLRSLRRKLTSKFDRLAEMIDVDAAARSTTIREFDDRVTAPINGFESAADYYRRCSSCEFLAAVRVPTLLIHAMDDPFLPSESIPVPIVRANPHLMLSLHERGGHVGFVQGLPWAPRLWGEIRSADYLAHALHDPQNGTSQQVLSP